MTRYTVSLSLQIILILSAQYNIHHLVRKLHNQASTSSFVQDIRVLYRRELFARFKPLTLAAIPLTDFLFLSARLKDLPDDHAHIACRLLGT